MMSGKVRRRIWRITGTAGPPVLLWAVDQFQVDQMMGTELGVVEFIRFVAAILAVW